ncbi:hypothetical protein GALL_494350 [mine drainage metagenome]|uniref:Uncharacterized protein n=1 Tax=mine drainage metagenome TaxID=410659 RepID=A0A1J5PCC0_9ZZZZ
MATGPEQQRSRRRFEVAMPLSHERLLQTSRLDQIPVKRAVKLLYLGQRLPDELVLVGQFPLHPQNTLSGGNAGVQLV